MAAPPRFPGWSRRRRVAAAALVVVALLAVAGSLVAFTGSGGGRMAPTFTVTRLGQPGASPISLARERGRPVVLNFFASWCPPCRRELPHLAALQRQLGKRVAFVGIDVSDSSTAALALVRTSHVGYPVGVDPSYRISGDLYHLRGLPSTLVLGPDGAIAHTVTGPVDAARLRSWLAQLAPGRR